MKANIKFLKIMIEHLFMQLSWPKKGTFSSEILLFIANLFFSSMELLSILVLLSSSK